MWLNRIWFARHSSWWEKWILRSVFFAVDPVGGIGIAFFLVHADVVDGEGAGVIGGVGFFGPAADGEVHDEVVGVMKGVVIAGLGFGDFEGVEGFAIEGEGDGGFIPFHAVGVEAFEEVGHVDVFGAAGAEVGGGILPMEGAVNGGFVLADVFEHVDLAALGPAFAFGFADEPEGGPDAATMLDFGADFHFAVTEGEFAV